jgi:hypothetical protein
MKSNTCSIVQLNAISYDSDIVAQSEARAESDSRLSGYAERVWRDLDVLSDADAKALSDSKLARHFSKVASTTRDVVRSLRNYRVH